MSQNNGYGSILQQVNGVLDGKDKTESVLGNLCSILMYGLEKISWAGFYILDGDWLHLGPFQGRLACTKIRIGKGVCGTAAFEQETILVKDVTEFPGHIACDAASRSEIVIPIIEKGRLWGVLDIDSQQAGAFGQKDKESLEELVKILTEKLNLSEYKIQ